jgi:enterochelin esterase-like enzyme
MSDRRKAAVLVGSLAVLWAVQLFWAGPLGSTQSPSADLTPLPDEVSGTSLVVRRVSQPAVELSPGAAMFLPVSQPKAVATRPAGSEPVFAPLPSRVEIRSFDSPSIDRKMHYLVYLPAGYDAVTWLRYPVLYLLHGIGGGFKAENGSNTEWYGYGATAAADELIAGEEIQPLLMVMPQGDQSFWMDHADSGPMWGQYVARDLVAEVDEHFRTIADARHRALGGLSMGGFGALSLAVLYRDYFGTAGAHSGSFYKRDAAPFFGDEDYFDAHDPIHLLHDRLEVARSLDLWLDVGSSDPLWRTASEQLHQQLTADGVPHEWHSWPGQHNGLYWHAHMDDYLRFYSASFDRHP